MNFFLSFLHHMILVTDCDGTLVHYEKFGLDDLLSLPPSSGSGKTAFYSKTTMDLLNSLISDNVILVCASGMRVSTMLQRYSHFPQIKYWICENGGRIFSLDEANNPLELEEWKLNAEKDEIALQVLRDFSFLLTTEGWSVDSNYSFMIRVKGENLQSIENRIPPTLKYSYNLGYLDIFLSHLGKLNATKWLLSQMLSNNEDTGSRSGEFYFMGDDDNDINIAGAAKKAFVVRPCSAAMMKFALSRISSQQDGSNENDVTSLLKPYIASNEGPLATNEVLQHVLDDLKNNQL